MKTHNVHLLGTVRNPNDEYVRTMTELTKMGYRVTMPMTDSKDEYEKDKERFNAEYTRRIRNSEICVIVTPDDYDEDTMYQIEKAHLLEKTICTYEKNSFIPFDIDGFLEENELAGFNVALVEKTDTSGLTEEDCDLLIKMLDARDMMPIYITLPEEDSICDNPVAIGFMDIDTYIGDYTWKREELNEFIADLIGGERDTTIRKYECGNFRIFLK